MYCAYLKQPDGGWRRTERVEDVLDHEGEIVQVENQSDEYRIVREIRNSSVEKLNVDDLGNLFTSKYRIGQSLSQHQYQNSSNVTIDDFATGAEIVVKNRSQFIQIHLNGKKFIAHNKGFKDIVGTLTEEGYILCKRDPVIAKACHDKRNRRLKKMRTKSTLENTVKLSVLQKVTHDLKRKTHLWGYPRKWTPDELYMQIVLHDQMFGTEATNNIIDGVASIWNIRVKENEAKHINYQVAAKLITKRFAFQPALTQSNVAMEEASIS